jgi:amino acid permease
MSSETNPPAEPAFETYEPLLAPPVALDDHDDDEIAIITHEEGDNEGDQVRRGTISSARFNILSTMVGGGCLSLPLAFQQSGNSLLGPLMLIVVALISDFCFRLLVASANHLNPPHRYSPGKHSFESITSAAFGPKAYVFSMALVTAMCFFGAVGYCVLLRDMVEPINDLIQIHVPSEWLHKNITLFAIMVVVTPLCTLQTFTALKSCGAASMMSILILGSCIVFRSIQCNMDAPEPFYKYLTLFPENPRELLDAVPLYISCFVCHYNILPVHNELYEPTSKRVSWWLRSTTWFAGILYLIMGFAGSAYGHCTATGHVQGNVLLDFDEDDPLLLVGRMCLALTITLAFPMLVIPARDIVLRSILLPCLERTTTTMPAEDVSTTTMEALQEPLLEEGGGGNTNTTTNNTTMETTNVAESSSSPTTTAAIPTASFLLRLLTAIVIFWTAGGVASCVESIDIVWDLLGSSLSILLSHLIPCGCYLVITKDQEGHMASKLLAWLVILVFTPLMFVSTANAVDNTFFH